MVPFPGRVSPGLLFGCGHAPFFRIFQKKRQPPRLPLALPHLQFADRFEFHRSDRDCCRRADRCALVFSFSAKLSFVGSIGAVITFLLTVSFLFSTPGAFQFSNGFPLLGDAGQFLIKDLVLLGAAVWTPRKRGNPTSRVVVLAS